MNKTISNRTFKWLAIVITIALILFLIFFLIEKNDKKSQSENIFKIETDFIPNNGSAVNEDMANIELPPKIIYKDTIIYKEKIVYKDTVIYKESPPKIEYRDKIVYQDKIIYQEKPEPFHQYGKGNGKITLFKTCNCLNLKFWIDGEYAGQTKTIFSSNGPECGELGAVSKRVLSGKHHITAQDEENHSWDFYVTIIEDECLVRGVKL